MYDPTLKKRKDRKEYCRGYLIEDSDSGEIKTPFNYAVSRSMDFQILETSMPLEALQAILVIETSRLDLNFAKNKVIELNDGNRMRIAYASSIFDNNKSWYNGDGRVGISITLKGGAND